MRNEDVGKELVSSHTMASHYPRHRERAMTDIAKPNLSEPNDSGSVLPQNYSDLERMALQDSNELLSAALSVTHNIDAAQDAVQETFLKLLQISGDAPTLSSEESYGLKKAFAKRTAINSVHHDRRTDERARRRAEQVTREPGARHASSPIDEYDMRMREQAAINLRDAIAKFGDTLDPMYQRINDGIVRTDVRTLASVAEFISEKVGDPLRQALLFLAAGSVHGVWLTDREIGNHQRLQCRPGKANGLRQKAIRLLKKDLEGPRILAPDEPRLTVAAWAWELIARLGKCEEATALHLRFFGDHLCDQIWEDCSRRDELLDEKRLGLNKKLRQSEIDDLRWMAIGAYAFDDCGQSLTKLGERARSIFIDDIASSLRYALIIDGTCGESLRIYWP
jgi:DNA-directed RNA polymerase specialized sigma24 family protein